MNPEDLSVGYGLLDLGTVPPEALAKTVAPVPASQHFEKVIRRAKAEEEYEKEVIKTPHAVLLCAQICRY